ncbi:MAG: AtpZ/AtpI family protein [Bacteroidales bacterium]|nr:AtpZ/AtpI family protein [Bacteroidales bacterium]
MKEKKSKEVNKYARFTSIAFEMMAVIGGLTWLGVWLDTKTRAETPWFTIVLAPFSVIAALLLVIRSLKQMD